MSRELPIDQFARLSSLPFLRHGFTGRVPGLDVKADRVTALQRLDEHHGSAREQLGCGAMPFIFGEQVHGCGVAVVDGETLVPVPGVDGLMTAKAGVCLGIYVADCAAVYLADPVRRVIGLLHSGRKGTALGIVTAAVETMVAEFHSEPSEIIAQLGPCIRPPHYEVDFAADILRQCRAAGVKQVVDCGVCTASNLDRYYSYRAERGQTGRMLAILALA